MNSAPLFLVPLRSERLAVHLGARRADVVRIGMGPARATAVAQDVAKRVDERRPLVVLGVCGGLSPEMRCGDVVVASSVALMSSPETVTLLGASEVAGVLSRAGRRVTVAPIVSSPVIVHGDEKRREASARGAVGVDMESYWCALHLRDRPLVVVRVVFDALGDRLLSPRIASAAVRSFRSVAKTARVLATSFPVLSL